MCAERPQHALQPTREAVESAVRYGARDAYGGLAGGRVLVSEESSNRWKAATGDPPCGAFRLSETSASYASGIPWYNVPFFRDVARTRTDSSASNGSLPASDA